jgi:hypothetical protein
VSFAFKIFTAALPLGLAAKFCAFFFSNLAFGLNFKG